ncbi:MAG: hypothetical protein JWM20_675 [Patescibacteria group bacterium]|nr:hypothetical protein [Patescibacteria group bacterium]
MKKVIILKFLVMFAVATFAKGIPFDGQNSRDSAAHKITVKQYVRLYLYGEIPSDITAFYPELPREDFFKAMPRLLPTMHNIIFAQLNAINDSDPFYFQSDGKTPKKITTVQQAEAALLGHVDFEKAMPGKHTFLSFDEALNGKTGEITRENYSDDEGVFVFTNKRSGRRYAMASDYCANPIKDMVGYWSAPLNAPKKGSGFEDFDKKQASKGKVKIHGQDGSERTYDRGTIGDINITVTGNSIENSGNSTVTQPAAPAYTYAAPAAPATPTAPKSSDWVPDESSRTPAGTNRTWTPGGYSGQTVNQGTTQYVTAVDPFAASNNKYLKRTANATTATAVGVWADVAVDVVGLFLPKKTNTTIINNGGQQQQLPLQQGQRWTGAELYNTGTTQTGTTTTGQHWTGTYPQ